MNSSRARVRVPLSRLWWLAFVLVPVTLGVVAALFGRAGIESDLQQRVERSVAGTGVSQVSVSVDGRDVTAVVPARSSEAALESVRAAATSVDGVRSAKVHR